MHCKNARELQGISGNGLAGSLRRAHRLATLSAFGAPIMECMAVAPAPVNESAKADLNSGVRCHRIGKVLLAARYRVAIRTIENWQYAGIIRAGSERGQAVFDVADCDERLLSYKE